MICIITTNRSFYRIIILLTRNAWQSLACTPRGITVNSVLIAPQNSALIPQRLAVAPQSERS